MGWLEFYNRIFPFINYFFSFLFPNQKKKKKTKNFRMRLWGTRKRWLESPGSPVSGTEVAHSLGPWFGRYDPLRALSEPWLLEQSRAVHLEGGWRPSQQKEGWTLLLVSGTHSSRDKVMGKKARAVVLAPPTKKKKKRARANLKVPLCSRRGTNRLLRVYYTQHPGSGPIWIHRVYTIFGSVVRIMTIIVCFKEDFMVDKILSACIWFLRNILR